MAASTPPAAAATPAAARSYARGARILSIGIAATGLFTFAFFAVASHVLTKAQYGRVSLLWSILFVVLSVMYRPVEQLLSRTIADRRARGITGHPLQAAIIIQAAFAGTFLVGALVFRGQLEDLFDGSATLFWIMVVAALAYAASYFARGYVAGHQWFGLYGGLVLFESVSRFLFVLAVALGITSGQTAVALGIAAAPFASLLVIPWAFARRERIEGDVEPAGTVREGGGFASSVAAIQLAEQTLLNAAVLLAGGSVAAGIIFSALLIARAPLQLFQAVQTSLLPHLASLEATEGRDEFLHAIWLTVRAIAAFAGACALGLLLIGPWVMDLVFGEGYAYGRVGLAVIAVGMGCHLAAGTFTQAALARGRAHAAATSWLICAGAFVGWMLLDIVDNPLTRAESGYAAAAAALALALFVELRSSARA